MTKLFLFFALLFPTANSFAQSDRIVLEDFVLDTTAPGGLQSLIISSDGSRLAGGLMYKPNGKKKHPTLILLHGLPGGGAILDVAQAVRAHGWNVIYFNYRGTWGSEGQYSFENSVDDLKNVVAYCNTYQDSLKIDTANIVLFGHSFGGFVCLKALEQLPQLKKGFALSATSFYEGLRPIPNENALIEIGRDTISYPNDFPVNATTLETYLAAYRNLEYYNLAADAKLLRGKQIMMVDEKGGQLNESLAAAIRLSGPKFFDHQIWDTDHGFSDKRVTVLNLLLAFLDK